MRPKIDGPRRSGQALKLPPWTGYKASDKVGPVRRSAGFQPAVSPISNRQNVAMTIAPGLSGHPQAGSTAIQRVGNLRYDFVHGPGSPCAPFNSFNSFRSFICLLTLVALVAGCAPPGARA